LTNDDRYWRENARGVSAAFSLHEGRVIDCNSPLDWHESTREGTKKRRLKALQLSAKQTLSWADYSSVLKTANGLFRYLCLEVVHSDSLVARC
jgi:hypothetical protein